MVELIQLTSPPATSGRFAVCTRSFIRFAKSGLRASAFFKSSSERTPAFAAFGDMSAASRQTVSRPCRTEAKAKRLDLVSSSHIYGPSFVSIRADALLLDDRAYAMLSRPPNSDRSPTPDHAAVRTRSDEGRIR